VALRAIGVGQEQRQQAEQEQQVSPQHVVSVLLCLENQIEGWRKKEAALSACFKFRSLAQN
jgi:hypothetical protein